MIFFPETNYLHIFQTLVVVLLSLAFTVNAKAQITLNGDFDHGSLDESNSSVTGSTVQLAGRDNFNPGDWKWLYFSAAGVSGQTLTFEIDDDFVTGGSNLNNHEMVYSYNQDDWFFFDNNARNAGSDLYSFSNNSPFTSNEVFVAYGLPYSFSRSVSHTNSLIANPWVSPTVTGGTDFVVGQSPGGVDDIGRVIPQQDLYGYKISDPSSTLSKSKIVLVGGVHSNETLGNHTLEAMVDYLASDDLGAAILRQRAEFYVYPMVNPDGRIAGYNRSTVEQPNLDPNRFWASPNYGNQTEIEAIAEAIIADTGGDTDFFIDFHSTVQDGSSHFGFVDIDRNFHLNPVWQQFLSLETTIQTVDASLINDTSARFGLIELDARFTMTFETRFIAGENEDRFVTLGQNFGQAFADIFASLTGDLNLDGDIDGGDWLLLSANAQTDLSSLSSFDAYAAGDINGDGFNDVLDFILFKDLYEQENGSNSFAFLVAGVPEPSSTYLVAIATFCLISHRSYRANLNCLIDSAEIT